MKTLAIIALAMTTPLSAQDVPPSPNQIVAEAAPEEWVGIAPEDLLMMTLAPDRDGNARQVVIQLMPPPFSRGWVENIRTLARAGWYDGLSINRVQDNYVVQWGDPDGEDAVRAKKLPAGLRVMGEREFIVDAEKLSGIDDSNFKPSDDEASETDPITSAALAELERVFADPVASESDHEAAMEQFLASAGLAPDGEPTPSEVLAMISISSTQAPGAPEGWHQRDSYAEWVEFWRGWPIANYEVGQWTDREGNTTPAPNVRRYEAHGSGYSHEVEESWFWPIHCYGMVGVGRSYSPDTGSGAELYTVIGHAPRHLDRNIALVGRVVEGIEHLSSLPRGTGDLGFYESAEERVPIRSIRLASDLTEADPASSSEAVGQQTRPGFQYLSTESETFARYAEARANRRDPFFITPAGGADICNIPVPVRRIPAK